MKILVTGAAGFIGHALTKQLLKDGYTVYGLDNINDYYTIVLKYARLGDIGVSQLEAKKWNTIATSSLYNNFHFIRMDIENREKLPMLFKEQNFDVVIHLAAQAGVRYSIENPEAYIDSNIVGFLNILECCRHQKVKHLVYASSSSVYGVNAKVPFSENDKVDFPISLYAASKKSNELMAYAYSHLYRIPTSGLRFFTVYGPWGRPDMAPMLFANAITRDQHIQVFNHGEMSRDFTYIEDIIQGIIIILHNPPKKEEDSTYYQLFNIGNGSPVSLMKFIETLEREFKRGVKKRMLPLQPGDVPQTWADTSRLNKLGYKSTTSIELGIKNFVEWYKNYSNS
ncbi:NAD-dependent epimerase/dehydratase family protein [Aequorivita marisscotiae]|uniref:GDP-mannose 4,6-dehydratase n=1 Tax=Aequorivita marisscotiae TaxID=3040348 RepID=A0ABY8KT42_9FLAO|nr:NAD-dependent epimerase/dehydratase family protein [Aequorivita sp. Ant34-E75]WGF92218.1 GDP-mannose 4,6-dehydratase [Aequorivita sp. Ant34-E75]